MKVTSCCWCSMITEKQTNNNNNKNLNGLEIGDIFFLLPLNTWLCNMVANSRLEIPEDLKMELGLGGTSARYSVIKPFSLGELISEKWRLVRIPGESSGPVWKFATLLSSHHFSTNSLSLKMVRYCWLDHVHFVFYFEPSWSVLETKPVGWSGLLQVYLRMVQISGELFLHPKLLVLRDTPSHFAILSFASIWTLASVEPMKVQILKLQALQPVERIASMASTMTCPAHFRIFSCWFEKYLGILGVKPEVWWEGEPQHYIMP